MLSRGLLLQHSAIAHSLDKPYWVPRKGKFALKGSLVTLPLFHLVLMPNITLHFSHHLLESSILRDRSSLTKLNFEWVKWATEQLSDSFSTSTTSSRIQVSRVQQNNLFTWALFAQIKVPGCITALLFLSCKSLHQLSTCFRRAADSYLHRTWNLGCGLIPAAPPTSQVTWG